MTGAGFLYDKNYGDTEKDKSGKILSIHLAIGTSFLNEFLQVAEIHNVMKSNKNDYKKEPAIIEVVRDSSNNLEFS